MISHKMKSGQRKDEEGNIIPRQIIKHFVCKFNGELVLESDWPGAVSADPYIAFRSVAAETGYVRPSIANLQSVRGVNSIHHNNAMQTWPVNPSGDVENVLMQRVSAVTGRRFWVSR